MSIGELYGRIETLLESGPLPLREICGNLASAEASNFDIIGACRALAKAGRIDFDRSPSVGEIVYRLADGVIQL